MLMDECARKEKGKHFSSVSLARGSVRKKDNPMLYTKHAISSSWPYSTTFFIPTMCLGGLVIVMLFASERRLRWFTFFCCYFDLSQGPPIFNFNDREREREKRNHWRLKQKRCIVRTDQPKNKGRKRGCFFFVTIYPSVRRKQWERKREYSVQRLSKSWLLCLLSSRSPSRVHCLVIPDSFRSRLFLLLRNEVTMKRPSQPVDGRQQCWARIGRD